MWIKFYYLCYLWLLLPKQYVKLTCCITAGPLPSTVEDMWRMIHQTKATVVIMVTDILENGEVCDKVNKDFSSVIKK